MCIVAGIASNVGTETVANQVDVLEVEGLFLLQKANVNLVNRSSSMYSCYFRHNRKQELEEGRAG